MYNKFNHIIYNKKYSCCGQVLKFVLNSSYNQAFFTKKVLLGI